MSKSAKRTVLLLLALAAILATCCQVTQAKLTTLLSDLAIKRHWKALHDSSGGQLTCNADALNSWLFFGEQPKIEEKYMSDLLEFPKRCDLVKLLDEKFVRNEARVYENVKAPLYEFLSEEFIEHYTRENRDKESHIHLKPMSRTDRSEDSCVPDARSEGASREAIKRLVQGTGKLAKIVRDKKHDPQGLKLAVAQYFEVNLVITCETYWQMLNHHLFRPLMAAINRFRDGDWTHITRQSDQYRNGLFRYLFCRRLVNDQSVQSKYISALANMASEI